MEKFKKITALLFLAAVLMCVLCVHAAADENIELITVPFESAVKDMSFNSGMGFGQGIGQELYLLNNGETAGIYRIDKQALEHWRTGGELIPERIKLSKKLSGKYFELKPGSGFRDSSFAVMSVGFHEKNMIVKYDSARSRIAVRYTTENDVGVTRDGIISEAAYDKESKLLTVRIFTHEGRKIKALRCKSSGSYNLFDANSEYVYFSAYAAAHTGSEQEPGYTQTVYRVDTSGRIERVARTFDIISLGSGYYAYRQEPYKGIFVHLYENDKTVWFDSLPDSTGENIYKAVGVFKTVGTKMVIYYFFSRNDWDSTAAVLCEAGYDMNDTVPGVYDGTALSGMYQIMNTHDNGRSYNVTEAYAGYGFLDSDGKQLGMFDGGAAAFGMNAEYTIVKTGTDIYLIGRSMNTASGKLETGERSDIYLLDYDDGELYCLFKKDCLYFVTYREYKKKNTA